jgi:hypothetical protein
MTRRALATLALAALPALLAQAPAPKDDAGAAGKARREKRLELFRGDAVTYTIYRDGTRREKVEMRPEPVYVWQNIIRSGGQDGAVFVWTCRGRAEVIGTIFSNPAENNLRTVNHELHSLATSVLDVDRPGPNPWHPEEPGLVLKQIPGAAAPAKSATQRLAQMRSLSREFSAHTVDHDEKRWELRLLPQPLYRFESADPDVVDGAVFAYVTSAGTDPEVILVIEARHPAVGRPAVWQYGIARFTDLHMWVRHKGAEVCSVPLIQFNSMQNVTNQRYRLFNDRYIPIDTEGFDTPRDPKREVEKPAPDSNVGTTPRDL